MVNVLRSRGGLVAVVLGTEVAVAAATGLGEAVVCADNGNTGKIEFIDSGQNVGNCRSFAVEIGDLDGDGDLDLFNACFIPAPCTWLNNGSGVFSSGRQTLGAPGEQHGVALGDMDGDGDLDAFVVFSEKPDRVYLNDGGGRLVDSGQGLGNADDWGLTAELGDLDGDGDLDAVVATYKHENRYWINDGKGAFTDPGTRLGDTKSRDMRLGDFDSDGDLDIYLSNSKAKDRVLLNDGNAIFKDSGQRLGARDSFGYASLADLDGDHDLDVFLANKVEGCKVFLNNGAGQFTDTGQSLQTPGWSRPCLNDLDGKNGPDAIVIGENGISVWLNDGKAGFTAGPSFAQTKAFAVAAGDLDGDHDVDLVIGKQEGTEGNRILLNKMNHPGIRARPTGE